MIINRLELLAKLQILSKAYSVKTPMPALQFLKIDNDTLTMSNNNITIMCNIEPLEMQALVPFKQLLDIVNKLNADTIELNKIENKINIKCGRSKFNLICGDFKEYPNIKILDDIDGVEIKVDTFKNIINKVNYACSKNEKRPILTGVNFGDYAVATDSYRLAKFDYNVGLNCTLFGSDLANLVNMLDTEKVLVRNNNYTASFEFGGTIYQTRLLDGKYPDTSRLITNTFEQTCKVNRIELIESIERVNIFNTDDKNIVCLNINNKELNIKNLASQIGVGEEILDCENQGEITIACTSQYLIDALNKFENDIIELKFNGELRPFIIEENNATALILPVRMD